MTTKYKTRNAFHCIKMPEDGTCKEIMCRTCEFRSQRPCGLPTYMKKEPKTTGLTNGT